MRTSGWRVAWLTLAAAGCAKMAAPAYEAAAPQAAPAQALGGGELKEEEKERKKSGAAYGMEIVEERAAPKEERAPAAPAPPGAEPRPAAKSALVLRNALRERAADSILLDDKGESADVAARAFGQGEEPEAGAANGIVLRGSGSGGGGIGRGALIARRVERHAITGLLAAPAKADAPSAVAAVLADEGEADADAPADEKLAKESDGAAAPASDDAGQDACLAPPPTPAPLPRRCHLAPTYHAGRATWARRLEQVATLPPALAALDPHDVAAAPLPAPEDRALAIDARLDRDAIDAPGRVWLRVWLRSTQRWGMRRPPLDLAVAIAPSLGTRHDDAGCRALRGVVAGMEAQDRLTLVLGPQPDPQWDGVAGSEAASRIAALCARGLPEGRLDVAAQHGQLRQILLAHAAAQHRVAGTRIIVGVVDGGVDLEPLRAAVDAGVAELTLTSWLSIGDAAPAEPWWALADAGHGNLVHARSGDEAVGARSLWRLWARVVARLVRVDIRLGPEVVALRVLGSRVLDDAETKAVRRREVAVDANLARVAGVKADRKEDGLGMTMLIPAFLGSDVHAIDLELQVPGPGVVADVVVEAKDLVRMDNVRASARAELTRLSSGLSQARVPAAAPEAWVRALQGLRSALQTAGDGEAVDAEALRAVSDAVPEVPGLTAALQAATATEHRGALLALVETWLARAYGCRVRPRLARPG